MEPIRKLRQCLIDTELARLRVIARLWGLELDANQSLEIVAELAEAMVNSAHASHVWETLLGDQRVALAALLNAGGALPQATFTRRFGEIRPMGPGRLEREMPWRNPISSAEGLWYRGLIYQGFAGTEGETYPAFILPPELQAALPVAAGGLVVELKLDPTLPPAHCRPIADLLLDDLVTVLAFVRNKEVRPSVDATWEWSEPVRYSLAQTLREDDAERLALILHLIDHLGWLRVGDDGRLRLAAELVAVWLKATPSEGRATLVKAWREMTGWNELWRLPSLQPDDTGKWRNDPTLARRALLRYLDVLAPGEWVTLDDFVAAIKAVDPDFQRPSGDYETWYIRDKTSGVYLTGFKSWDQVEGVLLRALVTGPAWWLGLVELGSETQGGPPLAFRPTDRAALPLVSCLPPPVVRSDLTVTMPSARRFERFQLARVADLVAVGDPFVYRLTPSSLKRARQQRISAERLVVFLDDLSDAPLPKPVRASLARWEEQGTEVWVERALLLRVASESVLRQIRTSPQTSHYISRIVGPKAAVVAEKDWEKLMVALAGLGLLVEVEE